MQHGAEAAMDLADCDAVTFDVWGTLLVDADPRSTHRARIELLEGFAPNEGAAGAALDATWLRHYDAWSNARASGVVELAEEALRFLEVRDPRSLTELIAGFSNQSLGADIRAVDGAREALQFLRERDIALGLVCDTGFATGAVVRQLLEREGLAEWLDVQIYSDEWGAPKPAPRLFHGVLAGLEIPPTRAIHVGDLLRTDVAGARGVGMGTIRITAVYDDPDPLPEADRVVDSHAALREMFAAHGTGPATRPFAPRLLPPALPDDEARLDRRIREGRIDREQLDAVAKHLAERHQAARCDDKTTFAGTVEKLATAVGRLAETLRNDGEEPAWLTGVEVELTRFMLDSPDLLRARVLAGRVRAVHGDLRGERISVSDDGRQVRLSDPFRNPLGPAFADVSCDLVGLVSELRAAGNGQLAESFLASYAEQAVDFACYGVIEFHARLQHLRRFAWYSRAAEISSSEELRERAVATARSAELALIDPARRDAGPVLVVATGGQVGTGKSTVSTAAALELRAPRLEVDRIRADVIDEPPAEPVRRGAGWDHEAEWERNLAPGFTTAVYAELFRQARIVLASGRAVVLDGCFGRRVLRETAQRMASEFGAGFVFFECRLDREVHKQRIATREEERGTDTDTWAELADRFEQNWQPVTELGAEHHPVDTGAPVERTRQLVIELLRETAATGSAASLRVSQRHGA